MNGRMEEDPRSSGIVAVPAMDEITEDSVPSSTTVVEDIENPAATTKIEENITEYCIRIESFLQTLEQSPKADAGHTAFFRVPPHMRGRGELLYDPKYINFSQIRSMLLNPMPKDNERKLLSHYYRHLQSILKKNKKCFTDCMEMMNMLKPEIRPENCYPVQDNLQKSVFSVDYPRLLGLLLSGCFIIDLFHRWYTSQLSLENDQECGGIWASELWVDLLLVENQIPFFILQRIQATMPFFIRAGKRHVTWRSLEELVFTFYNDFLPLKKPKKVNQPTEQFHHLLDFVHRSLLPDIEEEQYSCFSAFWAWLGFSLFSLCICLPLSCIFIPCIYICKCLANLWDRTVHLIGSDVTCACCSVGCFDKIAPISWKEYLLGIFRTRRTPAVLTTTVPTAGRLQEAGVHFKPAKKKGFVVEFKRGVLWLPRLHVRSNTYKCFMNLIAWEHCYPKAGKYFTNFVILMDYLINDHKDVEVLIQSGVLQHSLSTDDEVAQVFNNLGMDLVYTYDKKSEFLIKLSRELNNYRENKFNIWRANLMNEYFKSPWTIISVLAALFVILLTAAQTFFAVFSYFRPPN